MAPPPAVVPVKQHHYAVPSLSYVITLTIDNVCGGSASLSKQLGEMIGLDENRTSGKCPLPQPEPCRFRGALAQGLPLILGPSSSATSAVKSSMTLAVNGPMRY